jgi:hypothetical protein
LFVPGFFNGFSALGADARDFTEAHGFLGDDFEGIFFKMVDDFICVGFSDAWDESAAEVFTDAVEGRGEFGAEEGEFELVAVLGVFYPGAFEFEGFTALNAGEVAGDGDVVFGVFEAEFTDAKLIFFVEIDETLSTLSFLSVDRIQRIARQLDGMTQKAMEVELWDGEIRKGESHLNVALSDGSATVLNSGTALSAKRAIALLEHEIGQYSHGGEQGFIHMSRDVFSILSSAGQVFMHSRDGSGDHLQTSGGTPVVVGSGYSGNGPDGASGAEATADNKWIYATGTVKTFVGQVDVVNDNLAQAYDVSGNQNDMRLKAIRPVAAYFDTSIHLAIRVNLTA